MSDRMRRWLAPDGGTFYYSGDVNDEETGRHVWLSLAQLERENKSRGYHFFDAGTLRWFGSRNRHLVAGALVETRMKAPSQELRYGVTWFDDEARAIHTATFPTLARARSAAHRVHREGFPEVSFDG